MRTFSRKIYTIILGLLVLLGGYLIFQNTVDAAHVPSYDNFVKELEGEDRVIDRGDYGVKSSDNLRDNILWLFYPKSSWESKIYTLVKNITLWVMIIFIIWAGASLLLNKKPEESKKNLYSLVYILLWWVFIYASNWLFWDVLQFNKASSFTTSDTQGIGWFTDSLIWKVLFVVLSAIKAFAFFLAIIMTVVTWFKVISAWEWEKWKKLVKGLVNIVVALLIIKWIDFIYYIAADTSNFVENAENFIINTAKVFAYIYGVIIVIMVIVAWYLYITDGWSGSNFKKASNILINILLSALVLFGFLLILYEIFSEFRTWWEAVQDQQVALLINSMKYYT